MAKFGDWFVFLTAVFLLLWWIGHRIYRWLHEPPGYRLRKLARSGSVEPDETVELLERHGYDAVSGKHRIPLGVRIDDGTMQSTRLYFDYIAVKDNQYYLVRTERSRMPIEWTASGLRDRLLVYALLFPECEGILIAHPREQWVRLVRFKVEDDNG
ncbi:hypothetical protein COLU111180_08300 [Cohnella lubricantis]|uniref:Uncharacterized protein n=1 Tax=Cohnella lubricantis TaxID=2163172 RepID=A0A841T8H9_9BACL|nr:hypothetical protein [Cohnella lubricantis]MBB6676389.1 hypothetical protein [Cohnella lubricantis]MBP2117604.1 hypothetical protein [Cohnella lubricantis]